MEPTLQEARFNAVYEVNESEPTTRSKIKINWVRLFPTVLPVQVSLKDVFPEFKWRKNELTNKETIEKVLSYCFLVPLVESVEQMMNIKSIHENIIISFERNKGSCKFSKYRVEKFLKPFFDNMKKFQTIGVPMKVNGKNTTWYRWKYSRYLTNLEMNYQFSTVQRGCAFSKMVNFDPILM